MIEIIAMNLEDAKRIEEAGADRIELVTALSEGGLTPCHEIMKQVVEAVNIPVNVIIRPHSSSFVYGNKEINRMISDIKIARELGVNGVVLGSLDASGSIDEKVLELLLSAAEGLDITFHRAIDELKNPVEGIKLLAKYKEIKTVLTSGGAGKLTDNLNRINEMKRNGAHIEIMVGGGLNFENLEEVVMETRVNWLHFGRAVRIGNSVNGEVDIEAINKAVTIIKFNQEKKAVEKMTHWR